MSVVCELLIENIGLITNDVEEHLMKTVIIDNLEWQYEDDGIRRNWDDANEYAKSLGEGWRLPTTPELKSLIDYSEINPACINQLKCRSNVYWSGTVTSHSLVYVWYVSFNGGTSSWANKDCDFYVRCVRNIN